MTSPFLINYLSAIMSVERRTPKELKFSSKNQIVEAILVNVPSFKKENFAQPVGQDQTTLDQFLNNRNEGSEWTDPHGFKINVVGEEYKLSF